ncbi:transmembrane protein 62 isoform X2 [Dromiciops gliroides]|uniref:transmembrane protein 62 isoform X2 n=1 Tax=Dromiciops gliroides TaxID=33562 RepID=UPI001CC496D9|nr:transmembrane protein 62 isoform X2 [Dromiciops gliroides]
MSVSKGERSGGWMSVGLALKVVAGLAAAALAAVLLEHYGLVGTSSPWPMRPRASQRPFPAPGAEDTNIFWGLQISDLHISKFFDPGRATDLEKFCSETVDIIQPAIVLATGDLTDGLRRDRWGSRQFEVEWQTYQNVLKRTRVTEKTKWLDIRGNHDSFNIPSLESSQNYYRKYSAFRRHGSNHYIHTTPFGNYSFIYMDATITPGPKKPFNFYGILNKTHMRKLFLLTKQSRHSNHTIWFGHYTTSTIISPAPGIRTLMSSAIAYLCGHLHLLGGLMPVLHTRHPKGTLELELGDWKENRRILAFSPSSITSVRVKINDIYLGNAVHLSGPIFILKWNPRNYSEGSHTIEVNVQDSSGRNNIVQHIFSIKGDIHVKFDFMPSFILLTDHYIVARIIFVLIVLLPQLLLITFRYLRKIKLKGTPGCINLAIFSFNVLSKTDAFYYIVLFLNFYTALGPWFVGEIIDGKLGCCFSFGVFVDGHFFQGSMTFVFGIIQMLLFNIPLLVYLCWTLLLRCQGYIFSSHLKGRYHKILPVHILMLLFYLYQLNSCYWLGKAYGPVTVLFSPMYAWLALFAPVFVRWAWILSPSELRAFTVELKSHQSSQSQ